MSAEGNVSGSHGDNEGSGGVVLCRDCRYWDRIGDMDGRCRKHAPPPTERADQIAHWPHTHPREGCGDGEPGEALAVPNLCGDCVYWRRPNPRGGLYPQDRGDEPLEWWSEAGRCVRHAPLPSSDMGVRGFWRATHRGDSCAEGKPRPPRETS